MLANTRGYNLNTSNENLSLYTHYHNYEIHTAL